MANVSELQDFLYNTLQGIQKGTIDVEKAKAITGVANALVSSAKAEVEYAKALGTQADSAFLRRQDSGQAPQALNQRTTTPNGNMVTRNGASTIHKLK